jgi:hypothetical protein
MKTTPQNPSLDSRPPDATLDNIDGIGRFSAFSD